MHVLPAVVVVLASTAAAVGNPCRTTPVWAKAPAFTVTVSLSEQAKAKVVSTRETIVVAAYFHGVAISSARRCADGMGEIHVGKSSRELTQEGSVVFSACRYDSSKVPLLEHGEVKVLINVFSGRKSSRDNFLACDIYEDSISHAQSAGIRIGCRLIAEAAP